MANVLRIVFDEAQKRGAAHFRRVGPRPNGCLSGEWAGESVNELLGDLIARGVEADPDYLYGDLLSDICASFESGFENAEWDAEVDAK